MTPGLVSAAHAGHRITGTAVSRIWQAEYMRAQYDWQSHGNHELTPVQPDQFVDRTLNRALFTFMTTWQSTARTRRSNTAFAVCPK